jgi:uncharacterized protein (DUF2147 family)
VGGQALADAADAGVSHLVGTQLLQGYRRQDAGNWQGRSSPDMGSAFFSRIHQPDDGHQKISGCILHGLLCKSQGPDDKYWGTTGMRRQRHRCRNA